MHFGQSVVTIYPTAPLAIRAGLIGELPFIFINFTLLANAESGTRHIFLSPISDNV
jgi:hypothetical protein